MMYLLAAVGNDGTIILVVVSGLLLLGAFFYFCARWVAKKRTERFQQVAEELGLPFFPKGDESLVDLLDHLHLFSQGRAKKIANMLHGETDDVELAIFDYRYTVGRGKNSRTYKQSVIYFRSAAFALPQFDLRPEGLLHKIGGAFGYQDIDFDTHPGFSGSYLLRGEDETAIRDLFTDDLLAFFESQKKISVEGGGDQLVFYRAGKRIKPDEVGEFTQEGFRILHLFRGQTED